MSGRVTTALGGVLRVEHEGARPPFDQVRTQLAEAVGDGRLAEGTRLPTVRGLAEELGLAANTVARAYKELEAAGLVVTRGRLGTVVAPGAGGAPSTGVVGGDPGMRLAAADFARAARTAGLTDEAALALVRDALGHRR
ncbi:GntR family transcriptional regulator [Arthrobacter sp. NEB 688]|uniref:GntR family transcriptional regulator n=1 Tax=Arthrobacter sp. NEB 688 TaxID=904039 RepID=UPI001566688D|nr:GntR family transcriptional regulator [Arthrobacter sp. NEB 688]QKE82798.1 GntR family transcriptional regulator [Arthrobacter sp. NEB 688]